MQFCRETPAVWLALMGTRSNDVAPDGHVVPTRSPLHAIVSLILSVALHSLLVLLMLGGARNEERTPLEATSADVWSTSMVEVGTVPLATPTPPSPASEAGAQDPLASGAPAPVNEPIVDEAEGGLPERPRAAVAKKKPAALKPATAASAAPPSSAADRPATTVPESAGSLGAVDLPVGVRHFATAFTRALPAANYADSDWTALAPGPLGVANVEVRIDTDGRIEEVSVRSRGALSAVVRRTIDRALLLLRSGSFSLEPRRVQAGKERLLLEVTLSQRAASDDEARHLRSVGFEPPTRRRAGHARFTLNSGRHIDIVVRFPRADELR